MSDHDQPLPQHHPGWVGEDNCWHHGYEPIPEGAYRVCGECGHCFATEQDLIDADRAWFINVEPHTEPQTAYQPRDSGSEIYSCPLCTHHF